MAKYSVLLKVKGRWVAHNTLPSVVELPKAEYSAVTGALHAAGYPHMGYHDDFRTLKNGACILGYFDPMESRTHETVKLIPMEVSHA